MRTSQRERKIRNYVIARDGTSCCYCGKELSYDEITMEHIVPDSKRGTFNTTNLTVSCGPCNNKRGNTSFFKYCKKFNWSEEKLDKYRRLYFSNLKIKVLNIAKEELIRSKTEVPSDLITQACNVLKIKNVYFTEYEHLYNFEMDFGEPADRKQIKYCFEQLIKIIESESI